VAIAPGLIVDSFLGRGRATSVLIVRTESGILHMRDFSLLRLGLIFGAIILVPPKGSKRRSFCCHAGEQLK